MDINALPKYDMSDNPANCCPRFKSEGWDEQELHVKDKMFVRAKTRSFFHVPVNMVSVFAKTFNPIVLIASKDTLILDVHEKEAFAKGHLPGALSVPVGELDKRLDEFSAYKAEDVVVYCNDGSTRGPRETKQLNDAGFSKAMNLTGGVEGWKRANLLMIAL